MGFQRRGLGKKVAGTTLSSLESSSRISLEIESGGRFVEVRRRVVVPLEGNFNYRKLLLALNPPLLFAAAYSRLFFILASCTSIVRE
eukprot:scaffold197_cov268-Chaetoceros_neogracile.AAC.2